MLIAALTRRVASSGTRPLLTYYDGAADTRTELSATTFANWVDKTANLIADLGHEDGDPIDIALATTHPGHWVALVWIAAAWQRGYPVNTTPTGADLLVVGPDDNRRAAQTVACSLHPLGRGFPDTPGDALDYVEVFAQPDVHDEIPSALGDVLDGQVVPTVAARDTRLLLPDPVAGEGLILEALVSPLLGTGSTVVAVGLSDERLAAVAATEHATIIA
ncbi:TIGR03089 family protein [Tessaracoccus bendigoensis DSM 12906]|uniref:TIGR03089 family protein n=1 Tax=Tessaracoccus bendigoensis DSM 12906 TaxID=1123357 RepID=A0A1M6GYS0_9ACTN|nr:TIGR03089 family protein [Tessaracoccus bendigoensis]SHJ15109.1 TIGR03089 family protein [Tessaracoccus bendigoensis DSM 12906]